MTTLHQTINFEIIETILEFKKTEDVQSDIDHIPFDLNNLTISNHAIIDVEGNNKAKGLHELLINYPVEDIRKSYLYGRHILTRYEPSQSYFDLLVP
ncbi:hypothetical protein V3O24_00450 [Methylobacter sp. Wu8]|uniref:hypothetical protein n=1 Tax=Methylobacter sp. Wu8 TaxID=3118457 RepID=UPI002F323628